MLQHALDWAARGFRVFPCWGGAKTPALGSWTSIATKDPDTIKRWWIDPVMGVERNYNVGVLTTELTVIDIDVKKGKEGLASALALGIDFDTLIVRTPSGGYHLYYSTGGCRNSVSGLGPGIDTRGFNGYVLAPGSIVEGHEYSLLRDRTPQPLSASIAASLARSAGHAVRMPEVDLDLPASFEQARSYITRAAPAIEGRGGHDQTYQVACMCRDFGLSEDAVVDLMAQSYNPKCQPPWELEELQGIIANAHQYAQNTAGTKSIVAEFRGIDVPETPKQLSVRLNGMPAAHEIPPRPWVIPRLLIRQNTTLLIAEGSAGKSTLILAIAAHLALGLPFLGYAPVKPAASVIYNAEDDHEEMARRIHAVCQWFGFDVHDIVDHVAIVQPGSGALQLTQGDPPTVNGPVLKEIIDAARDLDAGMVALDPLVELHGCREDDNVAMRYVMGTIRLLARQANAAVLVAHHTSKVGMGSDDRAGNVNVSRGATAIVNSARLALTLSPATDADRDRYGIPEAQRRQFVRLDDAKMNLSALSGRPVWIKREGVTIANGDDVGVLVPHDMIQNAEREGAVLASILLEAMEAGATAEMPLANAVTAIRGADPLYAVMTVASVKARVEQRLAGGIQLGEARIRSSRLRTDRGDQVSIVLD